MYYVAPLCQAYGFIYLVPVDFSYLVECCDTAVKLQKCSVDYELSINMTLNRQWLVCHFLVNSSFKAQVQHSFSFSQTSS